VTEYYLEESNLHAFLSGLHRGPLYGTVTGEGRSRYEKLSDETMGQLSLRVPPPVESLKGFMFPAKERVALYPAGGSNAQIDVGVSEAGPQVIVGARACDLRALEILDAVFTEGDFVDPFYEKRRKCSVLVTIDCVDYADGCFCNLVGGQPYPTQGYDLNLSPITGGYLVSINSDQGKELVIEKAELFTEPAPEQLQERTALRKAAESALDRKNEEYKPKGDLKEAVRNLSTEQWSKMAAPCVECGSCTFVCPTCHCFLLYDQVVDETAGRSERQKTWDACVMANFSKMAGVGGLKATPRPELRNRFENRIRHKFEWMVENLDLVGCVGCGRCVEGCMGGSDIRDILEGIGS